MQFPAIMGGVVPVYNIKGVAPGQITLSGAVLADIYLGKIKKWNDPAIRITSYNVCYTKLLRKDKIIMGAERRSMVMPEEERRNTAYHEAGHAVVAKLLPKTDP